MAEQADDGSIGVRVHPAMVPTAHPLASGAREPTTPCSSRARPSARSCSTGGAPAGRPRPAPCSATSSTPPPTSRKGAHASLGPLAKATHPPIDDARVREYYLNIEVADQPRRAGRGGRRLRRQRRVDPGRWSRRAWATRPASCSSPTPPPSATCRPRCATCATSTSVKRVVSMLRGSIGAERGGTPADVSPRRPRPVLGFADVLLGGPGLATAASTCPSRVPVARPPAAEAPPTPSVATSVMWPFVEGLRAASTSHVAGALRHLRAPRRRARWSSSATASHVLELFQGPDAGVQGRRPPAGRPALGRRARRRGERRTIVVGHLGRHRVGRHRGVRRPGRRSTIVVLHPAGRVSDVQRRQMTTVDAPNVHNVADRRHLRRLPGPGEGAVRRRRVPRRARSSAAMNSINWGRVMAQVAVLRAGRRAARAGATSSCRPATSATSSPAGYAKRAGAPIERLVIATNQNDILARWVERGDLIAEPTWCRRGARAMDIQVSSNHERLLFELLGRDGAAHRRAGQPVPRPRGRRGAAQRRLPRRPGVRRPRSSPRSPGAGTDD